MSANKVVFENKGIIDLRAVKTFGVSAKEKEDAIGFFGTGLKYAIAILLREGLKVDLYAGGEHHKFGVKPMTMRGVEFNAITMNGEELPYTTKLGQKWGLWQAFRELYCNCLDENGDTHLAGWGFTPNPEQTTFVVTGKEFVEEFHKKSDIVLSIDPDFRVLSGPIEIYNIPSKSIFYRGIRVYDLPARAMFTYNITERTELTEDRTLKSYYSAETMIERGLTRLRERGIIRKVITAEQGWYESGLNFMVASTWMDEISPEFFDVLEVEFKSNNDHLSRSARELQVKKMNSSAAKHYEPEELTEVEQQQLNRAKSIILKVWPNFGDFPIMVVKNLGQSTMALADMDAKVIVVSKRSFEMGTKYLIATLIEEYFHLKTGYYDQTRSLQTYLFDSLCSLIENHVIFEPM